MNVLSRHPDWAVNAVRITRGGRQVDGTFQQGTREAIPPVLIAPGPSPEPGNSNTTTVRDSLTTSGTATLYGPVGLRVLSTDRIDVLTPGPFHGEWQVEGDAESWPLGTVIHLSRLGGGA